MSLCVPPRAKSWRQTLKFHSPVSPDPLNTRLLGFPKSPPLKDPRSANVFVWPLMYMMDMLVHLDTGRLERVRCGVIDAVGFQRLGRHAVERA